MAAQFPPIVTRLALVPDSTDWMDVLCNAERRQNSQGTASVAFPAKAAKVVLMEHIVEHLLHHEILLASYRYVLFHEAAELDTGAAAAMDPAVAHDKDPSQDSVESLTLLVADVDLTRRGGHQPRACWSNDRN